ncbi:MAG: hypothetical protein ABIH46_03110 [Chloroflexota bacterium]
MSKEVTFLSLEEILAADDIATKSVSVPEWGGQVEIRGLTKAQQQAVRARATKNAGTSQASINQDTLEMGILSAGLIQPHITFEQTKALRGKSAGVLDRIMKEIATVSGIEVSSALPSEEQIAEDEATFRE